MTIDPIASEFELIPLAGPKATPDSDTCRVRPFGVTRAVPVDSSPLPTVDYDPDLQVSTIGGMPAVEHPDGARMYKTQHETVEDHQRFPDITEDRPAPRP